MSGTARAAMLAVTPVSVDREHTLRGRRNLEWFFANRRWLRLQSRGLRAAYAVRPLPTGEQPILFLVVASKRDMKRAHDRNKAKRWVRAAIMNTPTFAEIEAQLQDRQLIVMLQVTMHPDGQTFADILGAVQEAAAQLEKRLFDRGN